MNQLKDIGNIDYFQALGWVCNATFTNKVVYIRIYIGKKCKLIIHYISGASEIGCQLKND